MVYLDYSATSPLLPEAKSAMINAMDLVGNASALHTPGHLAMNVIEDAREEIAKLINAKPEEILFTSGGTESNNTVTNIFAGESVAISAIEHPSLLESAKLRCNATIIPVDKYGMVKKEIFETQFSEISATTGAGDRRSACNDRPRSRCSENSCSNISLYSVMLANNEIGTVNDIKTLAKAAHRLGALFHTDATQALGKIPIDVKDLDVDYMTISSHKIGGPIGIGVLYIKKGSPFRPFMIGGHQEHGRRAGTYQTVNIAGFGAAAKYANDHQTWQIYEQKIRPLRNLLAKRILEEIPYSSINGYVRKVSGTQFSGISATFVERGDRRSARNDGPRSRCPENSCSDALPALPNVLNCSFEAAEGESIQLYLDAEGDIITSTGSACASGDGKPSHVIMATRNDAEIAHSSVRFSFGLDSTEKDVEHVMQYLPNIVKRLQSISTLKAGKIKKEDSYYGKN